MFKLGIIQYSGLPKTGFITEWTLTVNTVAGRTVTLPLVNNAACVYNCTVDWGDGTTSTITSYGDTDKVHVYAAIGTYNIEITGTCSGWSIATSALCTNIISWGDYSLFDGFNYICNFGTTRLKTFGQSGQRILAYSGGCTIIGLNSATIPTSIPKNLFKEHVTNLLTATFTGCTGITSIPTDLFRYNTAITTFADTFRSCSGITSIPTDIFRYNTNVEKDGFYQTFAYCSSITSIPTDIFRYNTKVKSDTVSNPDGAFAGCFRSTGITSIPTDLFRYNTLADQNAFLATFANCSSLVSVPTDLFRYNTLAGSGSTPAANAFCFQQTFYQCTSLETVPDALFKYNGYVLNFTNCFNGCTKLQFNPWTFYETGEEGTRFLNKLMVFTTCFQRTSFSGTQGTAPALWDCDYGQAITLDVAPVTDWAVGDIITGQTSGATSVVVSRTSATSYKIYKYVGFYTLGEVVGVTGDANKLADQGAARPTVSGSPTVSNCYDGAGNSTTSLSNYSSIPAKYL